MGNRFCGCSQVKLGRNATIDITEEEIEEEDDGGYNEGWTVSYTIYDSSCTLYLEKVVDKRDRVREVFLELQDDICSGGGIRVWIERAHTDFLDVDYKCDKSFRKLMTLSKTNETTNPRGRVTKTIVFCYGRGSKKGLVVVEWKKNSRDDEYPYTATVAHYYAISSGKNKIDIGLSMMVSIRVAHKNLDYKVEGPDQHPSSALFSMFEQVSRSGSWKPTACPHCADQTRGEDRNNLVPARPHARGGFLNNEDKRGNGKTIVGRENYVIRGSISYLESVEDTQRLRGGVSGSESDTEGEESETEGVYSNESGDDESDTESEDGDETEGEDRNNDVPAAPPLHGSRKGAIIRGGFLKKEGAWGNYRNDKLNARKEISFNFYKEYKLGVFKSM